jgi:2,4-dienoyl-CoA reductase (NADPH2)
LHHDGTDKTPQDVSLPKFWDEWNIKFPPSMDQDDDSVVPPPCHRDKLYLLQRKKGKLGATLGRTTGWIHRAVLSKATNVVEQLSGVQYDRVDENGHLHLTLSDGITKRVLEVDHIVVCAGQEVNNSLLLDCQEEDEQSSISFWKDRVYTIGGAYQAGELDAKRAIDMGTRLAMDIHLKDPTQCYKERPPAAEEKMYQWLRKWIK